MNMIVVDDEPKICHGLQKLLASYQGWEVPEVFYDAASALRFLVEQPVDVVITDIRMPDVSGLELISTIRETNRDTDIIILSGHSDFGYAQEAIRLGVRRYLTKPTKVRELVQVLAEIEAELEQRVRAVGQATPGYSHQVVDRATVYVRTHYAEKITLKDMAATLHISPNYLCRLFKKHTQQGLTEYITQYRIRHACTLLKQTDYAVGRVAEMVGFSDIKYFGLLFKKLLGVTPLEYRNGKLPLNSTIFLDNL